MRRLATALLAPVALAAALALAGAGPVAGAAPAPQPQRPHLDVIEVNGLLDPVQVDFVAKALREAERGGADALVIQLDSGGGTVSRQEIDVLTFRLAHARVPVAVWVGPSGARAFGQAAELLAAASVAGMATRADVGRFPGGVARPFSGGPGGPGAEDGGGERTPPGAGAEDGGGERTRRTAGAEDGGGERTRRAVGPDEALRLGLVDVVAPTLGDFIVELDGRTLGGKVLETAEVVRRPGAQPRRQPTVDVRFAELGLLHRVLHTAASPSVAYLLFVAGLCLVVLELYTAGIGVAAATGAGCLVLSGYGLGVLPARPYAVALLAFGVLGYAIDVQAGAPRTWTVIGTLSLAVGSVRLYEQGLAPSPLVLAVVVGGVALFMVAGMPAMVRSRFSTPTIGRESMVGELGAALAAVDPEGTVEVRGAPWPARTNRATPIRAGDPVRVVGIDGLLLEVEPEQGGAKDYRRQ